MKLKIFKSGVWPLADGKEFNFTPDVLQEIANSYDAEFSEAPVVVGHPKKNGPAFAWIKALQCNLNDEGAELIAEIGDATPEFSELIEGKYFKNISSAFYPPKNPHNPKPEGWYMRHLGMLGAHPPAIKGLSKLEFAENEEYEAFEFAEDAALKWSLKNIFQKLRDYLIEKEGLEKADEVISNHSIDYVDRAFEDNPNQFSESNFIPPKEEEKEKKMTKATKDSADVDTVSQEELTAREAAIKEREAAIAAKEAEFSENAKLSEARAFVSKLEAGGQITPQMKLGLSEFIARLPDGNENAFEFAEGSSIKQESPKAYMTTLLSSLPRLVEFAEVSGGDDNPAPADLDGEALSALAVEFMEGEAEKGRPITISQAMDHVQAQLGKGV